MRKDPLVVCYGSIPFQFCGSCKICFSSDPHPKGDLRLRCYAPPTAERWEIRLVDKNACSIEQSVFPGGRMLCASILIRGITIIIQILQVAVKRKRLDRQFYNFIQIYFWGVIFQKFTVHFGFTEENEEFNRSKWMQGPLPLQQLCARSACSEKPLFGTLLWPLTPQLVVHLSAWRRGPA